MYSVRPAQRKDCIHIHRLISDLADFENGKCDITVETLENDGFSTNPPKFYAFVAVTYQEKSKKDSQKDSQEEFQKDIQEDTQQKSLEIENEQASLDEQVIGFALTYRNYSTWKGQCVYLEDLFVDPNYRGQGIGTMLLKNVTSYALSLGSERLDWVCIDFNVRAQQFYESIGATKKSDWFLYRMSKEQMEKFLKSES